MERMTILASPERCFAVLVDFDSYPQWAADIKSVAVEERDGLDRATVVRFRAAAFGRSTSYTLRYDYRDAPRQLSWTQVAGDLTRRLDGLYRIEPADAGCADVAYQLVVELKVPLPGFVKRRAEERITGTALGELRARVEGRGIPGGREEP